MQILAIETSCDETAIAVVNFNRKGRTKILSNLIASQIKVHAPYGGVVPHLAVREHEKNLPILLKKAKINWPKIDVIAITIGPGLSPCLWQGVNMTRDLALKYGKKVVAINHLEGHIYAYGKLKFPCICLIVSGGHTQLVLMKGHLKYKVLGQTRDDAAGEAFDKVAKLLGLGYPGGPIISKMAQKGNPKKYDLPRPMLHSKDYDFSFSGLKTAVLYLVKREGEAAVSLRSEALPRHDRAKRVSGWGWGVLSEEGTGGRAINIPDLCASFQQAVIEVLISKTLKAAREFRPKMILLCGGVAANEQLRKQSKFSTPPIKFCTDNAVMIALAGYQHAITPHLLPVNKRMGPRCTTKGAGFISPHKLEAKPNLMLE